MPLNTILHVLFIVIQTDPELICKLLYLILRVYGLSTPPLQHITDLLQRRVGVRVPRLLLQAIQLNLKLKHLLRHLVRVVLEVLHHPVYITYLVLDLLILSVDSWCHGRWVLLPFFGSGLREFWFFERGGCCGFIGVKGESGA